MAVPRQVAVTSMRRIAQLQHQQKSALTTCLRVNNNNNNNNRGSASPTTTSLSAAAYACRAFHASASAADSSKRKKVRVYRGDTVKYSKYPSWPASADPPKVLDDGSAFISRKPKPAKPVTADMLPPVIKPLPSHIMPAAVREVLTDATPLPAEPLPRITKEQEKEMRALRLTNPNMWTVRALAKRYNCAINFVASVTQTPKERIDLINAEGENQFKNFHFRRKLALINKIRRRESW